MTLSSLSRLVFSKLLWLQLSSMAHVSTTLPHSLNLTFTGTTTGFFNWVWLGGGAGGTRERGVEDKPIFWLVGGGIPSSPLPLQLVELCTHILLIWLAYNEVQFTPVLLLFSSLIPLKLFSSLFLSFFFISKPFSNVACFPSQVLLFLVLLQNFELTPSLIFLQHP